MQHRPTNLIFALLIACCCLEWLDRSKPIYGFDEIERAREQTDRVVDRPEFSLRPWGETEDPIGIVSGVSTTPGAMTLTRMFFEASSTAKPRANCTSDALVAA